MGGVYRGVYGTMGMLCCIRGVFMVCGDGEGEGVVECMHHG